MKINEAPRSGVPNGSNVKRIPFVSYFQGGGGSSKPKTGEIPKFHIFRGGEVLVVLVLASFPKFCMSREVHLKRSLIPLAELAGTIKKHDPGWVEVPELNLRIMTRQRGDPSWL